MKTNLTNIPTANLVNALLDLLVQNRESLACEPLGNPALDRGYLQDNEEVRLDDALEELRNRWEHMPAADLITEEKRRRDEARRSTVEPILSRGKDW